MSQFGITRRGRGLAVQSPTRRRTLAFKMLAASCHGALRPRPAADEDSPLEERVRSEEAVDLLQGHAIVGADEWIAAQAGAGDEIDPAVVIDIRGRDADADERWVLIAR